MNRCPVRAPHLSRCLRVSLANGGQRPASLRAPLRRAPPLAAPLFRFIQTMRSFCLRVSGAVAPSAPKGWLTLLISPASSYGPRRLKLTGGQKQEPRSCIAEFPATIPWIVNAKLPYDPDRDVVER